MNSIRAERLKYNIEKQGASSVYVMVKDARTIDDFFSFDEILLDAPCSGSGTLWVENKNLQQTFTLNLLARTTKTQRKLLQKAVDILKTRGEMVYSTCSIFEEENEQIIQEILKTNKVEIVPIEENFAKGLPLLPTKIPGTLCLCPCKSYEGFFIAKLRKK